MSGRKRVMQSAFLVLPLLLGGCGVLVGAGATAGAYEYKQKEQLDKLEQEMVRILG